MRFLCRYVPCECCWIHAVWLAECIGIHCNTLLQITSFTRYCYRQCIGRNLCLDAHWMHSAFNIGLDVSLFFYINVCIAFVATVKALWPHRDQKSNAAKFPVFDQKTRILWVRSEARFAAFEADLRLHNLRWLRVNFHSYAYRTWPLYAKTVKNHETRQPLRGILTPSAAVAQDPIARALKFVPSAVKWWSHSDLAAG